MKQLLRQNRGFIAFMLALGLTRTAVADWNPIPSGSMRPTILEGDVVLINRLAYDLKLPLTDIRLAELGEPRRGDIVTFTSPADGQRLIKRVVGLPGDRIAMRQEQLYVNGVPARYEAGDTHAEVLAEGVVLPAQRGTESLAGVAHAVQFLPGVPARRDFDELLVPEGHYFMLGDNRDNSADSRYIGMVPRRALIGRAHHVLVSADWLGEDGWRLMPRFSRFLKPL
jgi:signal peptidase I